MDNYFARLNQINVNDHIEKRGQFSYLSWPFAIAQLRLADPAATWEIRRFDGLPYLRTETGYFVEVAVTVQGITLSQIHPVLDSKNRPIAEPTCFDINTSIQRALVKSFSLHGLGLYIYAGEDLPDAGADQEPTAKLNVTRLPTDVITPAQLRFVERLITETRSDLEQLLAFFGFESLSSIPKAEVNRVIRALESKRRAA
jgi:hypothetical protein